MAFRRRYRRPSSRARRYTRKRSRWGAGANMLSVRPTRLPRGMNTGVHHFKRVAQLSAINASAAGNVLGAYSFQFDDIPNKTEFTNLFDQYRINGISIRLVPNFTGSDLNPAGSVVAVPNIWSIIDYDDSVSPANLNEMLQYPNCKMTRGQSIHKRYFRPSCLLDVAGITTGVKFKQWINMANTNIPHYGFKYHIDQLNTGPVGTWRVFVTYFFSCKGVR